jgi:hypothetical protein
MPPCQPIVPLGRPSEGGLTGSPDVGRCSAKAAPSSPSRRRRRRRFPAPGRPPRPACPLGRGTGRYCPPTRWAREASAPLAASSWPAGQSSGGDMHVPQAGGGPLSFTVPSCERHQAGCPSGQRERSVKPSASPSQVRILDLPPPALASRYHADAARATRGADCGRRRCGDTVGTPCHWAGLPSLSLGSTLATRSAASPATDRRTC